MSWRPEILRTKMAIPLLLVTGILAVLLPILLTRQVTRRVDIGEAEPLLIVSPTHSEVAGAALPPLVFATLDFRLGAPNAPFTREGQPTPRPGSSFNGAYVAGVTPLSGDRSMVRVIVPAGAAGDYWAVVRSISEQEFDCFLPEAYQDRIYCIGPRLLRGIKVLLYVFQVQEGGLGDLLVFETSFFVDVTVATATQKPSSEGSGSPPTAIPTNTPTSIPLPSPTNTPKPPSATWTSAPTATPVPPTNTSVPTHTNTPLPPPTNTPPPPPTDTPEPPPTDTPVPPPPPTNTTVPPPPPPTDTPEPPPPPPPDTPVPPPPPPPPTEE
jgi:hypothetical protein